MLVLFFFLSISLTQVRVSPFGDTTAKFISCYPEYQGIEEIESRIVELTNKEREKRNLKKLIVDHRLLIAARQHSFEMISRGYFSHISPIETNKTPLVRIYNSGLPQYKIAENIAENTGDLVPILLKKEPDSLARIIHRNLMESPPHRENILNSDYTHVGVGTVFRDNTLKVTQNFADESGIKVDSVLVERKGGEYLMSIYLKAYILSIRVFMDEEKLPENSLEFYSSRIVIPLRINSGLHKIELCYKEGNIYRCEVRIYVQTSAHWNQLFQLLRDDN
ncbi:MAG: CAP domain-containing protein [candidate division WOR-3 bacterium]|nr:CAP domain-containing protein [candidate division WOR-3 bacterium]